MISVLLLGFDRTGREAAVAGEAVRTLASLVPAIVDGIVRDLCLAAPGNRGLSEVADHAGCGFFPASTFGEAIRGGARQLRCPLVLVTACGAVIERAVIDELAALLPTLDGAAKAYAVKAAREDVLGRLFPVTAPAAALLAPRDWLEAAHAEGLSVLVRNAKPARVLRSRIWFGG